MSLFSSCPVCHLSIPLPEIERHVNDHFEESDMARDMDLAQEIALTPISPSSVTQHEISFDEEFPETFPLRNDVSKEPADRRAREKINCLVGLQRRSKFYHVEDGLIALLGSCLELENQNVCSIISGYVEHFQSTKSVDFGWGCGWRNIQMLSSHLITQRQDVHDVLFGGVGFVPDIPSIQRWLELAWNMGFDKLGANSFGNKIYGSTKWIGTTECAALFRSFGLRARIVDFDGKRVGSPKSSGHQKKISRKQVQGPMDKYVNKLYCPELETILGTAPKFSDGQNTSSNRFHRDDWVMVNCGSSKKCFTKDTSDHHALVDWVWNYFSSESSCGTVHVSDKTCKQAFVLPA